MRHILHLLAIIHSAQQHSNNSNVRLTLVAPLFPVWQAQIEAERAAILAEERSNIERLLMAISATLNQDLPLKLAKTVRDEVDGMASGVAATLASAVQTELATSLPKVSGVVS